MSLQTTRSLEEQARLNKEMLRDLDTEIKQILSNIQTEKMLFEFKE